MVSGSEFCQVLFLLVFIGPADEGVDAEGVLHVDKDADGGIDGGDLFDSEDGFEEGSGGATVLLGNLDAHEAEVEELADEGRVQVLRLIHVTDEGGDLFGCETTDGVAEHALVRA